MSATPVDAQIVLPPLTQGEADVMFAAVGLFQDVVDKVAAYSETVFALRPGILDIRYGTLARYPHAADGFTDGLYRYRPLTRNEYRYLLLALENLDHGLGALLTYGDLGRDRDGAARLLNKIRGLADD